MTAYAIELQSLRRTFDVRGGAQRLALDRVDLSLPTSGVHGLLGPNGAGKTTICKIIATVLLPTSGRARVLGHDVVRETATVRSLLGIVFGGERGLYERLTAMENLQFWCAMHGMRAGPGRRRAQDLLERLGLGSRAQHRVETFSRGMKQRLHLARGLVSDPPVLLLDEPTVGMDPVSARDFRTVIADLRAEGRTVLLTTHDMDEAQALCDSVTFIDNGRLLGTGSPAHVRGMLGNSRRIMIDDVDAAAAGDLTGVLDRLPAHVRARLQIRHDPADHTLSIEVPTETHVIAAVMSAVLAAGHTAVSAAPPSLGEVYLTLLGTDAQGARRGMEVG